MADDASILAAFEAKFLGHGHSDTSGFWLKFEAPDWDTYRELIGRKGEVLQLVVALVPESAEAISRTQAPSKGPYGAIVKDLHKAGWFINPDVVKAAEHSSLVNHAIWVRRQPCAVCGGGEWIEALAERRCEYAHVRRADHDGMAIKGVYIGLPLCNEHHALQHAKGESAILDLMADGAWKQKPDPLRYKALEYLTAYTKTAFRAYFGVESLTHVAPGQWMDFADMNGLERYLPKSFIADVEI